MKMRLDSNIRELKKLENSLTEQSEQDCEARKNIYLSINES